MCRVCVVCLLTLLMHAGPRHDELTANRFYRVIQDLGMMGASITNKLQTLDMYVVFL